MNWENRTLGEIGEWGSGGTPLSSQSEYYDGAIPWLIIEDLNDGIVTTSQKTITELGLKNSSAKIVDPGTLLIAMYGSIGKLGIAGISCATNQAIAFCRCNTELVDVNFLFYYLLLSRKKLLDMGKGITQQNIGQAVLKEYPVPLPPLPKQRRIAALLARADHLRRLRRFADFLSASLLQSVFLEMFGDPTSNSRKLHVVELGDITESLDSKRIPVEASIRQSRKGQYRYYGASGIIDYIDDYLFDQETLLVAEDGANLLARSNPIAFIVSGKYWVNNHAHVLRMKSGVNINFLNHVLNATDLAPFVTGSAQPKLTASNLERLKIMLPLMPEQERFAQVVRRFESLRRRQAESARQGEGLFQALLARSFERA
jgi:restriction endonuclease S subunit